MTVDVTGRVPEPDQVPFASRDDARRALDYMGLTPGTPISEIPVDVVFIGSCTNGRIEDLRSAARVFQGRKVAPGVRALVVPGSEQVRHQAEAEGLDRVFTEAGAEWRQAGCSMCLAMNPDKLTARPALGQHQQPQLRGPPGARRPHPPGQPRHGRRRRRHRPLHRRPRTARTGPSSTSPSGVLIDRHGTVRHPPRPGGRARLDRRQHRPDHPGPLPEADRADRLRPPALRRQAVRARRRPADRRIPKRTGPRPRVPAQPPRAARARPSWSSAATSAAARAASTPSGPSPQAGYPRRDRPRQGRGIRRHLRGQRLQQRPAPHRAARGRLAGHRRGRPGPGRGRGDHRPPVPDRDAPPAPQRRRAVSASRSPRASGSGCFKGLDAIAETLLHDDDIRRHEQQVPAWMVPTAAG